ncbi:MAG: hypothetical protein M0T70_09360 [Geobacteraceae bacterium]|nr:hypothetical protein [Geobacteraceae bacterium]
MNRIVLKILLLLLLPAGALGWQPQAAWSDESVAQERVAYLELTKVRALSKAGVTYNDYRNALVPARDYVGLLRGSDATVTLLRQAMGYYEQALSVWSLQTDSEFPVDSLRTDEPQGAAILGQCPGIPRFHYKERDQIYVKDAVDCIWHLAAELLDRAPGDLR